MRNRDTMITFYYSISLLILIYFFFKSGILHEVFKSPISFINSFLLTMSISLFYLNDFQLSNNLVIRYIQILSFVFVPMYVIYNLYYISSIFDIVYYIKNDSNIDLHGHISIDKEAGKSISNGLNTIGSNIGLGATVAGLATAVAKGIAKTSMPPIQKAGVIIGAGIIGGLFHSKISTINRNNIMQENSNFNIVNSVNTDILSTKQEAKQNIANNISSTINKFVNDTTSSSPLEDLLSNIEITNYVCISLIIILVIQIIFKFYLFENVKLNLSFLLGVRSNNILEYYLNKIISLNKKMSIIYIWLILITLVVGLSSNNYALNDLSNNLDAYIAVYNSLKK